MSILPSLEFDPAVPAEPLPRLWSRADYYRMADAGLFVGQRAELIGGEVLTVSPQRFAHYKAIEKVAAALRTAFRAEFWVRMQAPLAVDGHSEPEPDVSVVPGSPDDYSDHPRDAVLVVEVSDTTLRYDRTRKASLYARAAIAEYWIVNLVERSLEVYREPVADAAQPFGFRYAQNESLDANATIAPLAAAGAVVPVAALLP